MALFGEKYGDRVRVVSVGDWARELCGGTHALHSGQLGLVKLLGESSIGAGVRRVEALVGVDAYTYLAREHTLVAQLTEALKARPEELPERVAGIVSRLRDAEQGDRAAPGRPGPAGRRGARRRARRCLRRRLCRPSRTGRHDGGRPAPARARRAKPAEWSSRRGGGSRGVRMNVRWWS